jgi:hypothetical protein
MSEEQTGPGQARPKITLTKRIVPFDESGPAEEPLFINYALVSHAGGCAYIDVGIIPLDDILSKSTEASFLVLNRLVMSKETFTALRDQMSLLLSNADRQVDITTE